MQTIADAAMPKNEKTMVVFGAAGGPYVSRWYSLGKMHSIIKALPRHRYTNQVRNMQPKSNVPVRSEKQKQHLFSIFIKYLQRQAILVRILLQTNQCILSLEAFSNVA